MSVYNPAAISYGDQLHVLQTDQAGRLVDHYWDGSWHWQTLGVPSSLPYGEDLRKPAPIVHAGRFHVFTTGTDGKLYDYSWNTSSSPGSGHWENRNLDPDHPTREVIGTPAPINYGGVLHVFVSCENGNVYDDTYNSVVYSGVWQWNNVGYCAVTGSPAAISYNSALHIFVAAGGLYDVWTTDPSALPGAAWHRDYHGNGGTSFTGQTPSVVNYNNQLHVYVTSPYTRDLYDHWWDGNNWHFDRHDDGGIDVYGTPAAIVYDGALHVYVRTSSDLYDHYWNGSWHWDNHGHGDGSYRVWSDPTVVNYNGNLHVYVSVESFHYFEGRTNWTYDLWDHYWNGSWHWDNHGNG
jgi:hypothetical protein